MRRPSLTTLAITCYVLGVAFLFPFEGFPWRLIGMVFFAGFAIFGIAAVATPAYLKRQPDAEELGE